MRSCLVALLLLIATIPADLLAASPVRLFFDTDMTTDCDDAGAMAVLHALADRGECEILATVTSVRDPAAARTVDAINHYYGRPTLPLGMVKGPGVLEKSTFTARIAADFPHRELPAVAIPEAAHLYRDILEKQPDRSVIIVTVGYLTNLRNLLQLPAESGRLSGRDLIQAKVEKWICMGGNFVGQPARDDLKLGNVNFQRDASAALEVIHHWPTPVIYVGREIGSVPSGLAIGPSLEKTPETNPVRQAYSHYFRGSIKKRHVADLTTVLFAVRGLRDYWDIQTPGWMDLRADMTFDWKPDPSRNQRYLLKKTADGVSNDRFIESVLDELLVAPPKVRQP